MKFEVDDRKSETNGGKHGVDLPAVQRSFALQDALSSGQWKGEAVPRERGVALNGGALSSRSLK